MAVHPKVRERAAQEAHRPAKEILHELRKQDWTKIPGIEPEVAAELKQGIGLPKIRTIQNWKAEAPEFLRDEGEAWSISDSTGGEALLVLESLASVVLATNGSIKVFSKTLAGWVARLGAAAPDLSPYMRYVWARQYAGADSRGNREGFVALDLALAFRPWRGDDDALRYKEALEMGIPPGPGFALVNTSEPSPTSKRWRDLSRHAGTAVLEAEE